MDAASPSGSQTNGRPSDKVLLSNELLDEALHASQDDGQTLDLSHRNLTELSDFNAHQLANASLDASGQTTVLRVALGYNRLTALPKSFIALARIRYLNLRSNLFSNFPSVLTSMPSLEVLDISRNRIKRLPPEPGALRNLRVFSISRNRFTKLPHYLASFHQLSVLKVSHNPIIWPEGMKEEPDDVDDSETMKNWIAALKRWLEETAHAREAENGDISSFDTIRGEIETTPSELDIISGDEDAARANGNMSGLSAPHLRSFSVDSVATTSSELSASEDLPSPSSSSFKSPLPSPGPPSVLPTEDLTPMDESGGGLYSEAILLDSPQVSNHHGRNASYSVGIQPRVLGSTLAAKKSLPDLRLGFQAAALQKRIHPPHIPDLPLPAPAPITSQGFSPSTSNYSPGFLPPANRINGSSQLPHPATDLQMSSVDPERNAYFRRFSIQRKPPTDRGGPSPALLAVVDAARGIFFALSQVYEALRQFTVSVTHEGLSGVLLTVLHPARDFLSQLIDALDRFDEQAQQQTPLPTACRSVIQACKDSVSIFGKVVGVLNMQLSLMTASHDPRYTRWLLLIIHGSMTEVAVSWQTIQENGDAIAPFLAASRSKAHASSRSLVSPITKISDNGHSPGTTSSGSSTPAGWNRASRRQGGSFGTRDFHLGRSGPSLDSLPATPPPLRRGYSNGGPFTLSNGLPTPSSSSEMLHSRDGSVASQLPPQSEDISSTMSQPSSVPQAGSHLAASAVDQDLLAKMDETIEVAGGVWSTLAEIAHDNDQLHMLASTLEDAQDITRRLRTDLGSFRLGSTMVLRRAIWEDANGFIKMAVQVLSEVRGISDSAHVLPAQARRAIAALGQLMQEFAMFLQISSFAPSPTAPEDYRPVRNRSAQPSVSESIKGTPRQRDGPPSTMQTSGRFPSSSFTKSSAPI